MNRNCSTLRNTIKSKISTYPCARKNSPLIFTEIIKYVQINYVNVLFRFCTFIISFVCLAKIAKFENNMNL